MEEPLTLAERIDSYNARMPYPQSLFLAGDGRIVGTWIMGNNYRATSVPRPTCTAAIRTGT